MELLVSTRKRRPSWRRRSTNGPAPGIACSSCTRTPSMSISHEWISRRVMRQWFQQSPAGDARRAPAGAPSARSATWENEVVHGLAADRRRPVVLLHPGRDGVGRAAASGSASAGSDVVVDVALLDVALERG